MRILVFGLPGSGKTYFADQLKSIMVPNITRLNADDIRKEYDDWDFSTEGRTRQAHRMRTLADTAIDGGSVAVIADFVCPTPELRDIYDADLSIWMDTIESGRFEDTNRAWVAPSDEEYNVAIKRFLNNEEVIEVWNALLTTDYQQD